MSTPEALLKRLYARLREVQAENVAIKSGRGAEPLAIIGVGCRFAGGVDSLAGFAARLAAVPDWVGASPAARPTFDGAARANWASSLIDDVDQFDAAFFGLSAQEAAEVDPQQRLLLEVAYRTMEDARYPARALKGQEVGVFVGMSSDDYQFHTIAAPGAEAINAFNTLGTARSVAAGRIAYVFDFTGPALQVDTACSSSLMAVHLACQSLRSGECRVALAGGVNLLLSAATYATREALGALSASGRCHTFSDQADGYARGEGCGLVMLKTLSAARADHDRVLAVIYASSANHDGHSNGLTAPNGEAQRRLMSRSLAQAGCAAAALDYVETHGTGTRLGDPIEVHAIGEVLGGERDEALWVGSLKSQLGHLEAAAGVASLIKTTALLQDQRLLPGPPIARRNPLIDWARYRLRVVDEVRPWPRTPGRKRLAAVNAFGLSGTNVNVIVGDAEDDEAPAVPPSAPFRLLCVSGKSRAALFNNLAAWREAVAASAATGDLLVASCVGKDHFAFRQAFVGEDQAALLTALDAAMHTVPQPVEAERLDFVFTGQGGELAALGECWPLFAERFAQRAAALPETLRAAPSAEALFAELALADCFVALGLAPRALSGVGRGMLAAAVFAGVLEAGEALRLDAAAPELPRRAHPALRCADGAVHEQVSPAAVFASLDAAPQPLAGLWLGAADEGAAAPAGALFALPVDEALATLYRRGAMIDFAALYPRFGRGATAPAYRFERSPLWTRVREAGGGAPVQRYRVVWQPLAAAAGGRWERLVVVGAHELRLDAATETRLAQALRSAARQVCHIDRIDAQVLAELAAEEGALLDLRFARPAAASFGEAFAADPCVARLNELVATVQALAGFPGLRYHLVLAPGEASALKDAPLAGFLRSASHELAPQLASLARCALADLDTLLAVLPGLPAYEQLAVDGGAVSVERVVADTRPLAAAAGADADGAAWITGGLGGLGLALARRLAQTGCRRLILSSRRITLSAEAARRIADLRAAGVEVSVVALDVADAAAVEAFVARCGADLPALRRVIHAAGVADLCAVTELSAECVARVCAAKINGAWNVHAATRSLGLTDFVLYSSIAAVWGGAGLSHYAAANAFLDALAAARRRDGLPAVAVNWGPWARVGMAATGTDPRAWGLTPMDAEALAPHVDALFARSEAAQIVCSLDVPRFTAMLAAHHRVPLIESLGAAAEVRPASASARPAVPAARPFAGLGAKERLARIADTVAEHLAAALNRPSAKALSREQPLHELGIDSLLAIDVTHTLSAFFAHQLPATLIFDHPTIRAVAQFIDHCVYPAAAKGLSGDDEAELLRAVGKLSIEFLDEALDLG
jgi:acyl transferase domain-containing protein/acyl carrier protein